MARMKGFTIALSETMLTVAGIALALGLVLFYFVSRMGAIG